MAGQVLLKIVYLLARQILGLAVLISCGARLFGRHRMGGDAGQMGAAGAVLDDDQGMDAAAAAWCRCE